MFVTIKNAQGTIPEVPPPDNRVQTDRGTTPITRLREGMLIETKDHGLEAITHIFQADVHLKSACLGAIKIKKHAFGPHVPHHDTIVSKETRLFLSSPMIASLLGQSEGLFPAGHLTIFEGVEPVQPNSHTKIHHILTQKASLVRSNGLWIECYRPAQSGVSTLDELTHQELFSIFDTVPMEHSNLVPPAIVIEPRA